jgi:uncharacterized protein (TIGR02246 family)
MVIRSIIAVLLLTLAVRSGRAQAPADAMQAANKLMTDVVACFNRADVKCMIGFYTADAIDIDTDGSVAKGKAAIEQHTAKAFAGPFKGAKATATVGSARMIRPDVMVLEGVFELTAPGQAAQRLIYLATATRTQGRWLVDASMGAVPTK